MRHLKPLLFLFACTSVLSLTIFAADTNLKLPTPQPVSIHYDLAFPGILPDHPLYKFKVLRDKIILYFKGSGQDKVPFLLLQADKGISATAILVDKGNFPLAANTLLKAEHNMTKLVGELQHFPTPPSTQLLDTLKTASKKHLEIINVLALRVPEEERKTFAAVADFIVRNLTSINDYQFTQ